MLRILCFQQPASLDVAQCLRLRGERVHAAVYVCVARQLDIVVITYAPRRDRSTN